MKLQLSDTRLLKESVNVIADLVNDVCFKITKQHVSLLATDPANVAMVDFKLMPGAFAEYDVQAPVDLSISLDNLKAILKRAKPEDSITLTLDNEKNRLKVELLGNNKRTFNLALISREHEDHKVPSLNFSALVDIPAARFDDAVADMEIISDSVALMAESGKFTVQSEGTVSDAKVELPATEESVIQLKEDDKVTSKYALSYLAKMAKGSKLSDDVKISFSQDYPLMINYVVPEKLELRFVLAPRVSND